MKTIKHMQKRNLLMNECMLDLYYSSNWLNSYSASSLCISLHQRPSSFCMPFMPLCRK